LEYRLAHAIIRGIRKQVAAVLGHLIETGHD